MKSGKYNKEVVGIVVGGGPAPGINGVISAATIEAVKRGRKVIGIIGGFKTLFAGDTRKIIELKIDDVSQINASGGSILRTSRDFPSKAKEQFKTLMATLKTLNIRYLISIGGEGTLFMSNWIENEAKGQISVVHVPKTIDNDIPMPGGMPTFGYETAKHWGVEIAENIIKDARSTGRWYFVTAMGRYTGHLALGIGKAAGATITLIPEEFKEEKLSFKKVADMLEGAIIKRLSMGRDYGVAVLAEGIANKFEQQDLLEYECVEKDETGRIRLSEIQLGRLMKMLVSKSLEARGIKMTIVDKTIGYELRAADPIPFDAEYTRNLGYGAVRFLLTGGTGSMIVFYEDNLRAVPFCDLFDAKTGKPRMRFVDISSEPYNVAREYMIRLEKKDFTPQNIKRLAHNARMKGEDFKKRFAYLV